MRTLNNSEIISVYGAVAQDDILDDACLYGSATGMLVGATTGVVLSSKYSLLLAPIGLVGGAMCGVTLGIFSGLLIGMPLALVFGTDETYPFYYESYKSYQLAKK